MVFEREEVAEQALSRINELHSLVISQEWQGFRRGELVSALEKSVSMLSELRHSFEIMQKTIELQEGEAKPDFAELLQDFAASIALLDKNRRFEQQKNSRAREINVLEKEETPEVYALLEQKLLAILLKARYAMERANIFLRKQQPSSFRMGKSTAKNLLDLLDQKETELQDLKGKYEDVRKRSYLGHIEEQTVSDLEMEVNESARTISTDIEKLSHNIHSHQKQLDYLETNYAELGLRLNSMEEKFSSFIDKSMQLASMLKKERDYAKRVVLEIEHETVQLRNTYTREMLALQGEKAKAGAEAGKKYSQEIARLEKALEKSEKDTEHFREIASEKMNAARELEKKMHELKTKKKKSH